MIYGSVGREVQPARDAAGAILGAFCMGLALEELADAWNDAT